MGRRTVRPTSEAGGGFIGRRWRVRPSKVWGGRGSLLGPSKIVVTRFASATSLPSIANSEYKARTNKLLIALLFPRIQSSPAPLTTASVPRPDPSRPRRFTASSPDGRHGTNSRSVIPTSLGRRHSTQLWTRTTNNFGAQGSFFSLLLATEPSIDPEVAKLLRRRAAVGTR